MGRMPSSVSFLKDKTRGYCKKLDSRPFCRLLSNLRNSVAPNVAPDISPPATARLQAAPATNLAKSLLTMLIVLVGPMLACGSFQPRLTPTSTPPATIQPLDTPAPARTLASSAPTALPTPTATFVPQPTATIAIENPFDIGDQARVTVIGGLNLREQPDVGAPIVTLLANGKRVLVLDGPRVSAGFIWWRVDDNQGNIGWVAGGQGQDEWISPQVGGALPVDRAPVVGDIVVVTLQGGLNVRILPGIGSVLVARADAGREFTVVAGPQAADNYFWYQIRSADGALEGWAVDGLEDERWLTPLE